MIGGLGVADQTQIMRPKDRADPNQTVMEKNYGGFGQKVGNILQESILDESLSDEEDTNIEKGNLSQESDDDEADSFAQNLGAAAKDLTAMKFEENKTPQDDDGKSNYSGRTISIARPSLKTDILTSDDSHKGMMMKQSPSFLKQWQKRYFVLE